MNQISVIGFGNDDTLLAGYAQAANERLGAFDLVIENIGANTLTLKFKELNFSNDTTYADVPPVTTATVVAGGTKTISFTCNSRKLGFFGTGNTKANVSVVLRNKADLRGAQIDIVNTGRKGWTWDTAYNKPSTAKKWGNPPDKTPSGTGNTSDGYGGVS
jgi:hypothetical protein